jgi:hypothetical protein
VRAHRWVEGPARSLEDPAQVIRSSRPPEVRPEMVRCLLTVETMPQSEGKQLDQGGRLFKTPNILLDGSGTRGNPKATE